MSYEFYNLIHLIGVVVVFMALGGTLLHVLNGGTAEDNSWKKPLGIIHGVAMLLILVGGFGAMARLGLHSDFPGWIWGKVLIWVLLGAAIALPYRFSGWAKPLALIIPLLGVLASWLVVYKPF